MIRLERDLTKLSAKDYSQPVSRVSGGNTSEQELGNTSSRSPCKSFVLFIQNMYKYDQRPRHPKQMFPFVDGGFTRMSSSPEAAMRLDLCSTMVSVDSIRTYIPRRMVILRPRCSSNLIRCKLSLAFCYMQIKGARSENWELYVGGPKSIIATRLRFTRFQQAKYLLGSGMSCVREKQVSGCIQTSISAIMATCGALFKHLLKQ